MPPPPEPVFLYHITHVRNLPDIVATGGLSCYRTLHAGGVDYVNVAHASVQEKRARKVVPVGAGGTLHDYVPFYFGPRSPMLYVISKGNVEGYSEGQRPVVHLVTTLDRVQAAGCSFVFTDGHAVKSYATFYDDTTHLARIDWPLMRETYWHDTSVDPNRSFRRQAEFLVHGLVPWSAFLGIAVIDRAVSERVIEVLADAEHRPDVVERPRFYY